MTRELGAILKQQQTQFISDEARLRGGGQFLSWRRLNWDWDWVLIGSFLSLLRVDLARGASCGLLLPADAGHCCFALELMWCSSWFWN